MTTTTLIKVGGSLLSFPDLPERIAGLLSRLRGSSIAFLIGGGEAADAVRHWDQVHQLGPVAAHRLAIDSLRLTARLFVHLVPQVQLCHNREEVRQCWDQGQVVALEPQLILTEIEHDCGTTLPASWSITSDSIAAWIADQWRFDRLILVKSVELPAWNEPTDAVDDFFPELSRRIATLGWVNLRGPTSNVVTEFRFPIHDVEQHPWRINA